MEKQHPSHHLARVMHIPKRNQESWDFFVKTINDAESATDRNVAIAGFNFIKDDLNCYQLKRLWYRKYRFKKYLQRHPAK